MSCVNMHFLNVFMVNTCSHVYFFFFLLTLRTFDFFHVQKLLFMQVATFLSTLNYRTIYLKLKTAFCSHCV